MAPPGITEVQPYDHAEPPFDLRVRQLVCCMKCHLVKSKAQFYEVGCENCPELGMKGERGRIEETTTLDFDGLISVMNHMDSWASKYLRLKKNNLPGCYAMKCNARISEEVLEDIRDRRR